MSCPYKVGDRVRTTIHVPLGMNYCRGDGVVLVADNECVEVGFDDGKYSSYTYSIWTTWIELIPWEKLEIGIDSSTNYQLLGVATKYDTTKCDTCTRENEFGNPPNIGAKWRCRQCRVFCNIFRGDP